MSFTPYQANEKPESGGGKEAKCKSSMKVFVQHRYSLSKERQQGTLSGVTDH